MTTVPTIVVHGGAGTYATIIQDFHAKKDIENGTSASASAEYSLVPQRYHSEEEVPAWHRLVVTDW